MISISVVQEMEKDMPWKQLQLSTHKGLTKKLRYTFFS